MLDQRSIPPAIASSALRCARAGEVGGVDRADARADADRRPLAAAVEHRSEHREHARLVGASRPTARENQPDTVSSHHAIFSTGVRISLHFGYMYPNRISRE